MKVRMFGVAMVATLAMMAAGCGGSSDVSGDWTFAVDVVEHDTEEAGEVVFDTTLTQLEEGGLEGQAVGTIGDISCDYRVLSPSEASEFGATPSRVTEQDGETRITMTMYAPECGYNIGGNGFEMSGIVEDGGDAVTGTLISSSTVIRSEDADGPWWEPPGQAAVVGEKE